MSTHISRASEGVVSKLRAALGVRGRRVLAIFQLTSTIPSSLVILTKTPLNSAAWEVIVKVCSEEGEEG